MITDAECGERLLECQRCIDLEHFMTDNSSSTQGQRDKRLKSEAGWKRNLWRIVRTALLVYLGVVLMLSFFQRKLIYIPWRDTTIQTRDAGLPPGRVHDIQTTTQDGLELHGWHVLADGHSAANREECDEQLASGRLLVLYFSGNAANRVYRVTEIEVLSRSQADAFIFDYRGYGDNDGSPSEDGLARDAHAIWQYATTECGVALDRIVLYGESLGGGVAIRLASELSQAGTPPAGLILRSTFSSRVDVASYHYPWLPVRWVLRDRFPSADRIPMVTCPILQLHGGRDTIVPIELGLKLFQAAPQQSASGIEKRFVELPRANHNDVLERAARELEASVKEFFATLTQAANARTDLCP